MYISSHSLGIVLLFCAWSNVATSQEDVPNDIYRNWNQFNVGTSITLKTVTSMGGQTVSEAKTVQELVEKNQEQVVVQVSSYIMVNGMEIKSKPVKVTFKKNVKTSLTQLPKGVDGKVEEKGKGKEKVKVGDKSYECNWIATETEFGGVKAKSKIWMADNVPGMMVKTVAETATGIKTVSELVSFTKK